MTSTNTAIVRRMEYRAKNKAKHFAMLASLVATIFYLCWRAFFTLPWNYSGFELACGILLLACESIAIIETFNLIVNSRNVVIPEMPIISDDKFLDVDVLVVTHSEDPELLYKTLNGCKYMHYPDKSRVHIYLCDDANRKEMKELADHMGVNYFGFDGNTTAKAGNLNYAIDRTKSPFIAIFDSDMIPTSDFLMETVPYFYVPTMKKDKNGTWRERTEEEKKNLKPIDTAPIGYVQTRQSFYNPDILQRNLYLEDSAPCDLDYYYREVNVCRMWSNSVAFGGSNVVFARQALEDVGGILYSITEDTATSIEILSKGYRTLGLDKELAHGLAPDTAFSFITQRQRWSRGTAHDITSMRFIRSKLGFFAKLSFFTSYLYWWTFFRRFIFIICPILWGMFGLVVADVTLFQVIAIWAPYAILYSIAIRIMSDKTQSTLWTVVIDTVQMPYLLYPVIAGTLKLSGSKFKVTPKDRLQGRNSSFYLAIPHIILSVMSVIAIIFCGIQVFVYKFQGSVIPLFWLVYNLYALVNSVIYYWGRENSRFFERIPVPLPVKIQIGNRKLRGITSDISEGGMAIFLDTPEYLPHDSDFEAEVSFVEEDKSYVARFKAQVRQVRQIGDQWKYSVMISQMDEKDRQEYLQILYDRQHLLPRAVQLHVVSDMVRIGNNLVSKIHRGERKLPRIYLNQKVETLEAGTVTLVDFNYQYVIFARQTQSIPERLTVRLTDEISFVCDLDKTFAQYDARGNALNLLYSIQDWKDLALNPKFRQYLLDLIQARKQTANKNAPPGNAPHSSPDGTSSSEAVGTVSAACLE